MLDGGTGFYCPFVVPKTLNQQPNMPSGVGTMIDRAASLQPARAPKQQIPLAPGKGRGRFPAHEEDRLCLPTGSVGSFLGKVTSTTDYWNTLKQTKKQKNKPVRPPRVPIVSTAGGLGGCRGPNFNGNSPFPAIVRSPAAIPKLFRKSR